MDVFSDYNPIGNTFVFRVPVFANSFSGYEEIFSSPLFREGLFIASRDLYERLPEQWQEFDMLNVKIKRALVKYILRATHRCTPFGLFAICGTGSIKQDVCESRVILKKAGHGFEGMKLMARLDSDFVSNLISKLHYIPELTDKLLYRLNNSGYSILDKYRYTEIHFKNGIKKYFTSEIEVDEDLEGLFNAIPLDGLTKSELVDYLVSRGIDEISANDFIGDLISNQVLVSNLQETITGEGLLENIFSKLPHDLETTQKLSNILTLCDTVSFFSICSKLWFRYYEIASLS
ncbi:MULTISPECIES: lantibiotic dehydratase [Chitinophagaceae]